MDLTKINDSDYIWSTDPCSFEYFSFRRQLEHDIVKAKMDRFQAYMMKGLRLRLVKLRGDVKPILQRFLNEVVFAESK